MEKIVQTQDKCVNKCVNELKLDRPDQKFGVHLRKESNYQKKHPEKDTFYDQKRGSYILVTKQNLPPPDFTGVPEGANQKKSKTSAWNADQNTLELYALQNMARKSMLESFYDASEEEEKPKKAHRVCNCRRDLHPVLKDINDRGKKIYEMAKPQIFKHMETGKTFYGGLQVCGSAFACPLCSPKISEIRAAEIRQGVTEWNKEGGICLFITLTFPHTSSDSLPSLVQLFKDSLKKFRKGKKFDRLMKEIGFKGLIKSVETTWGEGNGWHPHVHEIWFIKPDYVEEIKKECAEKYGHENVSKDVLTFLFEEKFKTQLFEHWQKAVVSNGFLAPSYERGMVIKVAETEEKLQKRLAEYLAKTGIEKPVWGIDDELVRLHSKKGKEGRFTPFDFLREQYNPELTKKEKYRYRCLFVEYVKCFKGVAKIFWSHGLKKYFKINNITDEEVAEEQTEKSKFSYEVPIPIWVFVIGINDHRAELLLKVKNEGVDQAKKYLSSLLDEYQDYFPGFSKYDDLSITLKSLLDYYSDSP